MTYCVTHGLRLVRVCVRSRRVCVFGERARPANVLTLGFTGSFLQLQLLYRFANANSESTLEPDSSGIIRPTRPDSVYWLLLCTCGRYRETTFYLDSKSHHILITRDLVGGEPITSLLVGFVYQVVSETRSPMGVLIFFFQCINCIPKN